MNFKWKKGILSTILSISLLAPMFSPAVVYAEETDIQDMEETSEIEEIQEGNEAFVAEENLIENIEKVEIKERENASEKEVEIDITVKNDFVMEKSKLIVKGSEDIELEDPKKEDNIYTFKGSFEVGLYTIDSLKLVCEEEKVIDLTSFKQHFEITAAEEETDAEESSEKTEEEIPSTEDTEKPQEVVEDKEEIVEEEAVVSEDDERFLDEEEEEIVQEDETLTLSAYLSKANNFISDSRWSNGTYWDQREPKLSKGSGLGCYAYCLDFCAYVFGEYYNFDFKDYGYDKYYDFDAKIWKPVNFTSFTSASSITTGDIIATGDHYFVVIRREGNKLYTCEGATGKVNPTSVVVTTTHYEIRNGNLYDLWKNQNKTFYKGYRYNNMPIDMSVLTTDERVEGYSITLDGSIGVNFYMTLTRTTKSDSSSYIEFTLPNGSKTTTYVKDALQDLNGHHVFPVRVSAKDMTGNITAKLYRSGSLIKTFTYTVEEYANYIINHSSTFDSKSVSIAKAMLTYGKYVQMYFNFNTSKLPTKVNSLSTPNLSAYKSQITDNNSDLDFVGAHLTLTSTPELKLYFDNDATFKVNGERVSATKSGKYYVITISNISNMETMYTITAENFSMKYGIFSYGYQALNNSTNTNLQNMIKAMYAYDQVIQS